MSKIRTSRISDRLRSVRCPAASAVVVAAGSGTRFGGDKLMTELGGIPVLIHTLRAFERSSLISEIVLVTRSEALEEISAFCASYGIQKLTSVVPGGATRTESCFAGAMAVSGKADIIAIHDGARPLVTEEIIDAAVWAAYRHSAAVPAVPVRDTVKMAAGGVVTTTPERELLYAVQTPQCFQKDLIKGALLKAVEEHWEITDDCMAVERIGGKIWLTEGSEENLKITTPLDLELAELIWRRRQAE